MSFTLRPYQQEAVHAALSYFRREHKPAVIVLPTGAGKSLVIAELARLAYGRVLVLEHVKKLVSQNHAKFEALGMQADIFSAGLCQKKSQSKVVFGSVQSVARHLDKFDDQFSLVIIDECHRIADHHDSQYQQIVGRGLRLSPGKQDCLILDYAGNQHDLYLPEIGCAKGSSDNQPVQVFCPRCQFANIFWGKISSDGVITEHFGRRCQGVEESSPGEKVQCSFRFRFKLCPECQAENDTATTQCQKCEHLLVDPDDMLKAALRLKNARVLRCAGMQLTRRTDRHGDALQITYYDEDGTSVSELFHLNTAGRRHSFRQSFLRVHHRAPSTPFIWQGADDIIRQQSQLRYPDFIVAHKQKYYWQIRHKVFDYQGRYRRAASA